MALSEEQNQLIGDIDSAVHHIVLAGGYDKDILRVASQANAEDFKGLLRAYEKGDLKVYCQHYKNFYRLMKLLDTIAFKLSQKHLVFIKKG